MEFDEDFEAYKQNVIHKSWGVAHNLVRNRSLDDQPFALKIQGTKSRKSFVSLLEYEMGQGAYPYLPRFASWV